MSDDLQLKKHPVFSTPATGPSRVVIFVNDRPLEVTAGISLAAALWVGGIRALRLDEATGQPRGMYCGIGHCCECRVTLDGMEDVRSCLVQVRSGMRVELGSATTEDNGAC